MLRLRMMFAALVLLVAFGGFSAFGVPSAAAQVDPQQTNIPYLAWAGETVKVVKCLNYDGFQPSDLQGLNVSLNATLNISDWSGTDQLGAPNAAFFLQSNSQSLTVTGAFIRNKGLCWSGLVTAEKPGLATLKLTVNDPSLLHFFEDSVANGGHGVPAFENDVIVIWMQSQAPVITEVPTPGDPAGDGTFKPVVQADGSNAYGPGLIKAEVRGTFPLGQNWANLDFTGTVLRNGTVTLPDDWSWLANKFALDTTPAGSASPGAAAADWDIHDDNSPTVGNYSEAGSTSLCTGDLASSPPDAVDNCNGSWGSGDWADYGPFSNIFSGTDQWVVGPFDATRATETLLSDGKLDASDAPMPALRVDVGLFDLIQNPGNFASIGTLSAVDKTDIYIRDPMSDPVDAHNLYAPFYKAYIPAAWGSLNNPTAGVYGPSFANNFSSFLTERVSLPVVAGLLPGLDGTLYTNAPLYNYWNTFPLIVQVGSNGCFDATGNPAPRQTGNIAEAVYTDEHGEAYVQFNAGSGMVLTPDANGLCDPGQIQSAPQTLGLVNVRATSVYPDQIPTWDNTNKNSNLLTFTQQGSPGSSINCLPKDAGQQFCALMIRDIRGNPVSNAPVEFSAAGDGTLTFAADSESLGGYDTTGQGGPDLFSDPVPSGGFIDLTTGDNGEAGVLASDAALSTATVTVEEVGTRNGSAGITRTATIDLSVESQTIDTATAGGTVADSGGPVQTSVTTPAGGAVSITEKQAASSGPTGFQLFGDETDITAPGAAASFPLTLAFSIDPSLLNGVLPAAVQVFRDGVVIADCTTADGTATPDPCVFSRSAVSNGGASIVVLSSHASHWTFGYKKRATPALTWANPSPINYGVPLGASQLHATASIAGTFSYSPAVGTVLQPGTQTLSVTFTPNDIVDFTTATKSVQITVGFSQPCITTSKSGPYVVSSGSSICISSGGKITGPLTVQSGGALWVNGGTITAPTNSTSARALTFCATTISAPITVSGSTGYVLIGGTATTPCAGNKISGTVNLSKNSGGLSFSRNSVTAPVTITNNSGGFTYTGNTITGPVTLSGNS